MTETDEPTNDRVDLSISTVQALDEDEEEETEAHIVQDDENVADSDDEPLLKRLKSDKKTQKTPSSRKKIDLNQDTSTPNIPVRVTKRIMNLCPRPENESMTISMEAAVLMTNAAELFVQKLADWSYENSQKRQRSSVRYEDVAEVRVSRDALNFLEPLFP